MDKIQFKQEWSVTDHEYAKKYILSYLKSRRFDSYKSESGWGSAFCGMTRFIQFSNALGLAYTSSSSYAGLWACSDHLYLDTQHKFHLVGFAIGEIDFTVYAIWWDEDENEIIFPIGK